MAYNGCVSSHSFSRLSRRNSPRKQLLLDGYGRTPTPAARAAVSRHLTFLETIGLIESVDSALQLATAGEEWLVTQADRVLFDALHANVAGFEIILEAVQERPRTDDELMTVLNDSGPFNMESPDVAARHREWLEVLGYVERSGGRTQLTTAGAVFWLRLQIPTQEQRRITLYNIFSSIQG